MSYSKKQIMESRPVSAMGRAIERLKMKKITTEYKPYKCSICYKTFVSKQGLNGHIQRLKKKQMATVQFKIIDHCHYKCSICGKNFVSEQSLKKHVTVVHEDLKLNKCNVCEKHFSTKYQLNEHIPAVHEGIKPYK
jgi:DNA-directed RNA polymerase subunit RPC12/RpoP